MEEPPDWQVPGCPNKRMEIGEGGQVGRRRSPGVCQAQADTTADSQTGLLVRQAHRLKGLGEAACRYSCHDCVEPTSNCLHFAEGPIGGGQTGPLLPVAPLALERSKHMCVQRLQKVCHATRHQVW
jgi:hypothetical protein